MNILLLGGTSDARKVVKALDDLGVLAHIHLIYSVAGLVRIPELPCTVISGGFSQFGGLTVYLTDQQIDLIVDVTHPFAQTMSTTAVMAAKAVGIPCWRFHRHAWQAQEGDNWRLFTDWAELLNASADYRSVFLTAGQLDEEDMVILGERSNNGQLQVLRTAAPPKVTLPSGMQWVKAIGPFKHDDEKALLEQFNIDLLISKNSGGKATEAKLSAARELGVDVFMLERPNLPSAERQFTTIDACAAAIKAFYEQGTDQPLKVTQAGHLTHLAQNKVNTNNNAMTFTYEANPQKIEQESFCQIRQLTDLSMFNAQQQQVVMRIVHSLGMPELSEHVRFSTNACQAGMAALAANKPILCDVEMVKQGVTKRMVANEPLCFLNDPQTQEIAKATGETRSMAAVNLWRPYLEGAVVIIGNAPTALFKLLEMIQQGAAKPALVIGMPVGFVGAAESKDALWEVHNALGIECITLLGRQGGSAVSAATCNALLRCNRGEMY